VNVTAALVPVVGKTKIAAIIGSMRRSARAHW
jgi:hypothetical protein